MEIGNIETGNTGNIGNNPHWVDVEAEGVTPVSGAELTNETFAGGETATATIPLSSETPPAFFGAKIEEQ